MKKKIFAANWKMNKSFLDSEIFCKSLKENLPKSFFQNSDVFIFPQNFSLAAVANSLKESAVEFGPQQFHTELKGAFTGENSLDLAKALGSNIGLVGHSERRRFFQETELMINMKIKLCQSENILPVFCIGETLQQREAGLTENICQKQIESGLQNVNPENKIIIAYEPVWAIGTGKVATTDQVRQVHHFIFELLTKMNFKNFSILYGGSVKLDNAKELISLPHVDGFLIGGASLEIDSFLKICLINE